MPAQLELKSMYLGNAANEFQVTRLTGAYFIVSTPKQIGAQHQTCRHMAVHGQPDSAWDTGRLKSLPRFAAP
jgi:hypothetical protein